MTPKNKRTNILFNAITNLTALEMTWLTRIILKDSVSMGYSDSSLLRDMHPDAQRVYDRHARPIDISVYICMYLQH